MNIYPKTLRCPNCRGKADRLSRKPGGVKIKGRTYVCIGCGTVLFLSREKAKKGDYDPRMVRRRID